MKQLATLLLVTALAVAATSAGDGGARGAEPASPSSTPLRATVRATTGPNDSISGATAGKAVPAGKAAPARKQAPAKPRKAAAFDGTAYLLIENVGAADRVVYPFLFRDPSVPTPPSFVAPELMVTLTLTSGEAAAVVNDLVTSGLLLETDESQALLDEQGGTRFSLYQSGETTFTVQLGRVKTRGYLQAMELPLASNPEALSVVQGMIVRTNY
jgi:hypothetical protein